MTASPGPLVLDSSAAVALVMGLGGPQDWVAQHAYQRELCAPALMPYEAMNVLRRYTLKKTIDVTTARLAWRDLSDLSIVLFPSEVTASRALSLWENVTCYDAAYVALAEMLDAPLITTDRRMSRAPNLKCTILLPPTADDSDTIQRIRERARSSRYSPDLNQVLKDRQAELLDRIRDDVEASGGLGISTEEIVRMIRETRDA